MFSDDMMEMLLNEQEVPSDLIYKVAKEAIQSQKITPVYMGTALGNKGVQPLIDAVCEFLPSPLEREIKAKAFDNPEEEYPLLPDASKPFVGMGFKLVEDAFGLLTYMRIYQGTIKKGETCLLYTSPSPRDQRGSRMPSSA